MGRNNFQPAPVEEDGFEESRQIQRPRRLLEIPADDESESALLGCLIRAPDKIARVAFLEAQDFSSLTYAKIYAAICRMSGEGREIDPLTLKNELDDNRILNEGEADFLIAQFVCDTFSTESAVEFAKRIKDASVRRRAIEIGENLGNDARRPDTKTSEILDDMENRTAELRRQSCSRGEENLNLTDALSDRLNEIYALGTGEVPIIPLPWPTLDIATGGMMGGHVTILIGSPGSRKTWLALAIALSAVERGQGAFLLYSEMTASEIIARIYAILDQDSSIANPRKSPEELNDLTLAASRRHAHALNHWPLHFSQPSPDRTFGQAFQILREKSKTHKLLIIDHIGGIRASSSRNTWEEEEKFVKRLVSLAITAKVHVLILTHTGRGGAIAETPGMGHISGAYNDCKHVQNVWVMQNFPDGKIANVVNRDSQFETEVNGIMTVEKTRGIGNFGARVALQWVFDKCSFEALGLFKSWKRDTRKKKETSPAPVEAQPEKNFSEPKTETIF